MIKNIVFDVGNVLVDFRWRDYMKELGFDKEKIEYLGEKVVMNPLWEQLDLGDMYNPVIYEKFKESVPGYEADVDLFFSHIEKIIKSFDYSKGWCSEMRSRGYKVFLLSNYAKDLFELHCKDGFTFINDIDGMIVSGYEGIIKPDKRIYELLFERYSLKAEECIFIDDRSINVEAAIGCGMKSIVFTTYDETKAELEKLLV